MPEQQNSSTSIALSYPLVVRSEIIRQEHILNICMCVCVCMCMYVTGRNGEAFVRSGRHLKLLKLSVYHPGVFTNLNKMVFISQTHLILLYLMYYSARIVH